VIVFCFINALYYIQIKPTSVDLIKIKEVLYMKKSSFAAMISGTVSGVLFALGMCMALIPEWGAFKPGLALGSAGLALALITVLIWRRMEHKEPVRFSGKVILSIVIGIAGAMAFGVGMCFSMIWGKMTAGIVIGLAGIVILLCLIPLAIGIKE
jgi:O-antigen/teichoic acid export membrane protein